MFLKCKSDEMQIRDNWTDFMQPYDYNEEKGFCTFNLISVCLDNTEIKKTWQFT